MTNYAPTAFSREITARIRGYIARFDINQADLAILCDVSQSQFSKIIRGARPMTIDQLAAICSSLGIDLSTLVEEVETFVSDRQLLPTPVQYVTDEERAATPTTWSDDWLDEWALAAKKRIGPIDVTPGGVILELDVRSPRQDPEELPAAARQRDIDRGEDQDA